MLIKPFSCVSVKDNFQIFSISSLFSPQTDQEQGICYMCSFPDMGRMFLRLKLFSSGQGFCFPECPRSPQLDGHSLFSLSGWCHSESLSSTCPCECVSGSSASLSLSQSFMVPPIMKSSLRTLQAGFSSAAAACVHTHMLHYSKCSFLSYRLQVQSVLPVLRLSSILSWSNSATMWALSVLKRLTPIGSNYNLAVISFHEKNQALHDREYHISRSRNIPSASFLEVLLRSIDNKTSFNLQWPSQSCWWLRCLPLSFLAHQWSLS